MHTTSHATPGAPQAYGQGTKKQVFTWSLWDWGENVTNSIMLTFVFTVYLTSESFGDPDENASQLSLAVALTGAVIALTAPVLGLRADRSGRLSGWDCCARGGFVRVRAAGGSVVRFKSR